MNHEYSELSLSFTIPTLVQSLRTLCEKENLTLSAAESCTGGALAASIVSEIGVSAFFCGSLVAYSELAKTKILKVSPLQLSQYGAVSQPVALSMLHNVIDLYSTDIGIAITGHAGSNTDRTKKSVYIAIGSKQGLTRVFLLRAYGNRKIIMQKSVYYALLKTHEMLRSLINKKLSVPI